MKITGFAKKGLAVATFAATAAMASGVQANAIINQFFVPGINQIQDTNVDRICSAACTGANSLTTGAFAVGQVIESLLKFDTVNITSLPDVAGANYKLFAYSTLTITGITGQAKLSNGATNGNGDLVCDDGEVCVAITNPKVEIYEGSGVPSNWLALNPDTAVTGSIAEVKAETKILEIGLVEADDYWYFNFIGGNDSVALGDATNQGIAGIATLTSSDPDNGAYVFGVSAKPGTNTGNLPFLPNGIFSTIDGNFHDFVGNGSAKAKLTGTDGGWLVQTDTLVAFAVPEPGTLALLGIALAGAGFVPGRRRQK